MKQERLHWVDISKGILMLMVVFGHMDNYAEKLNISYSAIYTLCSIERMWAPFFMCAFFVLTGYCSNFDKPFKPFVISRIKTLVLPSITIGILIHTFEWGGIVQVVKPILRTFVFGPVWFLSALFVSSIFYYLILRFVHNQKSRIIVYVVMIMAGLILNIHLPQTVKIWYLPHALMLTIFLEIGTYLRSVQRIFRKRYIWIALLCYSVSLLVILGVSDFGKVGIFHKITIDWTTLFLCYVCSVAGSILVFSIANFIRRSFILEYLGKNSLVLYLLNTHFICIFYKLYKPYFDNGSLSSVLYFTAVYISTLIACSIISRLLTTKYTSFILGKF